MAEKDKITKIAVINPEKCKPEKCNLECKKSCPVNRIGKKCIEVTKKDKIAHISEVLCIGCGICIKKCPFGAINIINLPTNIDKDCSFRYGSNTFKLHRLPIPKAGKVLGLVGSNGIGKSTALKILAGKVRPNFGKYNETIEWLDVAKYYKGSELHGYFINFLEGRLITATKIQYIDKIPRILFKMFSKYDLTVREAFDRMDERGMKEHYIEKFEMSNVLDRKLDDLSGGELQRFSVAVNCMKNATAYVFDEASSFLDIKQRLFISTEIRKLCENNDKYVVVVEHDLAIADLMCDVGCVMYGVSSVYGIISAPFSIKQAINIFLDGFIPTENLRFRNTELKYKIPQLDEEITVERSHFYYPGCSKTYCSKPSSNTLSQQSVKNNEFTLKITEGSFSNSEITVLLGENGMGKSTFVHLLAGLLKTDDGYSICGSKKVSLKPQRILPKFKGTVRDLFFKKLKGRQNDASFQNEVVKPLNVSDLMDTNILNLSGGELQRISIIVCLAQEADIYLLDEPAAYLDSDQRIIISKMLKRFMHIYGKTGFIVEHDLTVATYVADRVIIFEGEPGKNAVASKPMDVKKGMNVFLKMLDVTFRKDKDNFRPRINKPDSTKDREQKASNQYYYC